MCSFRHDENIRTGSVHDVDFPSPPKSFFASDNFSGTHPRYLDAISRCNAGHVVAYGGDENTRRAKTLFQELCDEDVEVLFTFNGTGSNVVALGSLLGHAESVVCTNWSHINVDETGAPEKILGVKLQDVTTDDAKVRPEDLASLATALGNVHHVQPGVVSITQATELGGLYSIEEISSLCDVAHSYGMRVHLDGARIANAVAALGGDADTFRKMTFGAGVDAVSFGGTKNAMLGAEAVLLRRGVASPRAAFLRKQSAQLPSKQRYVSAQFVEALESGLWLETASHANAMARRLYDAVADLSELQISAPAVNSLYPVLPPSAKVALQDWSFFWDWDISRSQVRWMTSWDTTPEDVGAFAAGVRTALSRA
jgi:threonine aldolase